MYVCILWCLCALCVCCGVCCVCVCIFVYFVVCVCVCVCAYVCVCVHAYVCVCVCVCRLMWWSQLSTAHKALAWLVLWLSTPFHEHDTDIPHGFSVYVIFFKSGGIMLPLNAWYAELQVCVIGILSE